MKHHAPAMDRPMEKRMRGDREVAYYCYCIARREALLALEGLQSIVGGSPPYAVPVGGMQAIVSRVPGKEYCEERLRANLQRAEWLKAAVLSHEQVVEGCLRETEVVPMRFGTIFRSEGDLVEALSRRQDEMLDKMVDLRGKQEWGIRLIADQYRLRQYLMDNDVELNHLRDGVALKPVGAAYFFRKRLEERLTRRMEQARAEAAQETYVRLAVAATRATVLERSESAAEGEPVLNAAFLVTREQLEELLALADRIISERSWLGCQLSGPWPPYSFV